MTGRDAQPSLGTTVFRAAVPVFHSRPLGEGVFHCTEQSAIRKIRPIRKIRVPLAQMLA
ncbi:MAG: hypothetical protein K0S86_1768, partial [Geminicoccaceae bacterium]|nr:hypothetical protein [Geminicoccaceae bacterium]